MLRLETALHEAHDQLQQVREGGQTVQGEIGTGTMREEGGGEGEGWGKRPGALND